jgi:hypothetical protein
MLLHDYARFHCEDPDDLVLASLACGLCLRSPTTVLVIGPPAEAAALCHCATCGAATEVALQPDQELRLITSPPRSVIVAVVD